MEISFEYCEKSLIIPISIYIHLGFSSCTDANSPTDTICSSESSAMMCKSHLQYDQHSSEEELEVINGPSSVAAAEAAHAASNVLTVRGTSSLISERGTSSLDPDELHGEAAALKRSSSTLVENRKRSLAHSSDDDVSRLFVGIQTYSIIYLYLLFFLGGLFLGSYEIFWNRF